jgi:hypothetical protein
MAYGSVLTDVVQSSTTGTPPQFNDGSGTQVGTLCRAWVNFNGVTTATIRASFNVSSVTRNGTGDYTINFTIAMPDTNYIHVAPSVGNTSGAYNWGVSDNSSNVLNGKTISSHRVSVNNSNTNAFQDAAYCYTAYFR